MPVPIKIPTFEELMKRVKEPKVPETEVAPEFRNLPMGWSVKQTPIGDSLISPRGLTFSNIKLDQGKITDFQAFRGDKPIKKPKGWQEWEARGRWGLPPLVEPPKVEPIGHFQGAPIQKRVLTQEEKNAWKEYVNVGGRLSFTEWLSAETAMTTIEKMKEGATEQQVSKPEEWKEWEARGRWGLPPLEAPPIEGRLRSEEGISSQEFESLAGMTLEEYSVALLEGRTERISQPGERIEGFETPEGERRVRIEGIGEDLSPLEMIYRFQTGEIPAEALPEPVRALAKGGKTAIGASESVAFSPFGVPITYGDIAAIALIGFGIYQVGTAGWNMLLDRVLKKPGDLNLLGRKLTEAGLNRNLNILERQSGVKIPKETRSAFIQKYLSDMAASWARNVAGQGRTVNTQSLQLTSQATYAATANAVQREIQNLIPKAPQSIAMAQGGLPAWQQPTVQSVVAKIMNNQTLTLAERQLYANEAQAVEAALQEQVTPTPPAVAPEVRVPTTAVEARQQIITKEQMIERGAGGSLSRAIEVDIPLVKVGGREPAPAGEFTKGTPVTQPIEVVYQPNTDTYILYAGNHRVIQAEVNEQTTIRAFVEPETGNFNDLNYADFKPVAIPKAEVTPRPPPEAPQAITKPVAEKVEVIPPTEPIRAEIAKQAEQLKAKLAAQPVVEAPAKPQPVVSPVERRAEIKSLLTEPAKNLPKGTTKITLRKELAQINKTLIPQEKALRSQIMATVKGKSLGMTQSRNIFREVGGSRYLTNQELTELEKTLKAIQKARPITIRGKKVITPKREALIQSAKKDLIDQGILTEETYKDILKSLNLTTDKYVDSQNFITNSEGSDIIRTMRNKAILHPLGELEFKKPTAIKYLTSQTYYAQVLGLKPLTNPLELAKVDFDLAYRAMSNAVDQKLGEVNKAWGVSPKEILESKAKNIPTKGSSALRDLLDKNEEAPAGLTDKQKELFNWFRNLNRSIINGENEVRRAMGVEEISYRQAYVRHVPDEMARNIIDGTHPIPPSLQYWAKKLVSKKIFNPMELHRQLSDDLANLYSKDLAFATKNMVYTGLKEIHLAQPLRAFTERMGALSNVIPASTRKWVTDYVNQVIKGQQTEWDESINAIVTESGIGGVIDTFLKPFNRTLGQRPITRLAQTIGNATIYSVLGLPRPRLARLMIRNLFQRTQELALHGVTPTLKSFLPDPKALKDLKGKSRYLKSYTGIEEWPTDLLGKVAKIPLAPYQFTATLNADRGMSTAYHDFIKFITNKKYKDMVGRTGNRWPSEQRTYKEEEGFLYPEEQKILLEEMELATRATQYQYIGLGMPEIFRHKTLIPFTRLQSWWMNHFTMFHREAFHRFAYGETMSGYPLPWSSRVNWLKYLLLGGAILTSMGYTSSYLIKVLPHNESPFAQFAIGAFKYVSATSDWSRAQAKWDMQSAWKAMVPGALAIDEIQKLWTGETPLWQTFFYGREEQGPPPRVPDYGFPIEPSALKQAETILTESISKLGKEDVVARTEAVDKALEAGVSKEKLREINAQDWTYDITSLRRDISDAIRNLEEDDIAELEPIVGNYAELKAQNKAYELLGDKEQKQYIKDNPEYITNRLFWNDGNLLTIPDLKTAEALVTQANKYNIPLDMIPAFQLTDKGNERIPSNRNLWEPYFTFYDLPGTSYLNMSQAQVDAGRLPEKYRQIWEGYQKLKTDTARTLYRKRYREASYSKWRDDFRRTNPEFDQWLQDEKGLDPLTKRVVRRTGGATRMTLAGGFGGVSARPRRAAVSYPKFKKPRISTGISVRAPSVPRI